MVVALMKKFNEILQELAVSLMFFAAAGVCTLVIILVALIFVGMGLEVFYGGVA